MNGGFKKRGKKNNKKPGVPNKKCSVQNTIKDLFLKLSCACGLLTNNGGEEGNEFFIHILLAL